MPTGAIRSAARRLCSIGNCGMGGIGYCGNDRKVRQLGLLAIVFIRLNNGEKLRIVFYTRSEYWLKLECNSFKVNIDAAIFKREGKYGFGGVIRDHRRGFVLGPKVL